MANNDLVARALAEREKHFQTKGAASAAQPYSPAPSAMVQKALAAQKAEMQRRQVEAPSKLQEINSLLTDWGNGYKQALMDYSGRYQGRTRNYQDKFMADSSQALEGYRANKSALQKNANQITQLLDEYGYYMDQGAVKQIRDQLRHGGRIVEGMEKAYSDSADFFGEFENEDAYIQWQDSQFRTGEDQYQERLDWYDESESRLASLEDIDKQYTQMMQKGVQNASGGIYNDGGRYSPGYNSRNVAQKPATSTGVEASYGKEAADYLKQNGFDSIEDLRAEIEGLKSERTRYERGEGEWSGYDEEGNKYFRNLTSDRNLAKLTDKGFLEKAEQAASMAYIPSFEELAEMDSKIFDQNFTMDLDPNGQTVAYSSVDGSQLIQDKDGNFHHALEYDPKYTSIDRLGLYLSASAEDKAAHAAISTWDNIYGQGIANHWDFLTPEEVSIYYGLKASSDAEAMDFLAEMQSTLNHRYEDAREKETVAEYENAGWLHRLRMQGRGFIEQGLSGIANAVVMTKSAITGDEVDAYGSTYSGTRYTNAVRGAEAERLEKMIPGEVLGMSAGDVYQAFMSAADSALYNAVPVVGTALTALSGSANDVIDKYAQGASDEQIIESAATTFAIEMATESAGFEKLKLLKEMDVNTWGDYFLNVLKQGGTELLEEETSYVLNGVADMINRRSQSDWSKLWKKYEENPAMAVGAITGELLQSGLSGLLSGMMGAGASTIRNAARNTAQTRNVGKAVKATKGGVEGLKGYASQIAQNGNDRGLDRFAGKLTDKSSNARVGKAYRMTEASVREQNKAELAKTLQEKGYSQKQAQQIAEAAVSSAAGWRLTEKQQSIWNAVQHDPEVMEAVNHALTGEDSGVRRRNQLGEDFRSGVKAGDMAKSQTLENDDLPEMTQELRRQLRKSGMPVAEEAAPQSDAEDPSTPLRDPQDDSVSQEGSDLASPEMRQAMQEAYANDEISEEEYDDYLDALSEQQGMEGVTEEGMRLKEQNDAVQRMQEQADPYNFGQQVTRQMLHNYGVEDTNGGDPSTPLRDPQDDRNTNGGTDNGTGVLHGSGQRNDRASAGEPSGSVAGRAGQDQARGGTGTDRVRAKLYRQDLGQNLREAEAVSSRSQGVTSGTDNATFKIVPESMWDTGMREADEKAYRETGKHITYVAGPIEMVGKDGKVRNARGVTTDAGILVRIDGKMDGERIADHEIFHGLMDLWDGQSGRRVILDGLMDELLQHYDREQLRQMLTKYQEALRGIYTEDSDADPGGDVLEDVDYHVLEELLADAYAGINGHAMGVARMQDAVRQWLRDNYIEQDFFQDNGTEQPTGPPTKERFSYGGEKARTANLDALRLAKEMQAEGVADETIRQQTGWFVGRDGKWRFEIDDSGMRYDETGDMRKAESAKWAQEDFESARDDLWDHADMDTLNKVRAYNRADIAGDTTTKQSLYDELISGPHAYYFGQYTEALVRAREMQGAPAGGTLQDYIDHPALYEAYPQLKDVGLRFERMTDGTKGYYNRAEGEIVLDHSMRYAPEDSLIHEIQHTIQEVEGFAKGSSPEYWKEQRRDIVETIAAARKNLDMWLNDIGYQEALHESLLAASRREKTMDQHWKDMADFKANSQYAKQIAACEAEIAEFQRQYDEITGGMTPTEQYLNTAGEIEARDAASRRTMTAEERKNTAPDRGGENVVFADDSAVAKAFVGWTADGNEVYQTSVGTMGLSTSDRIKKFKTDFENDFEGRTAKIRRNGHTYYAQFSRDSSEFGKLAYEGKSKSSQSSQSGYKAKIRILADGNIFELVEDAEYWDTAPESGGKNASHKDAKYWDYFVKTVVVDGKAYDVLISVRLDDSSGKWLAKERYVYSIRFRDNKTAATSVASPASSKVLHQGDVAADVMIAEDDEVVKERFSVEDSAAEDVVKDSYSVLPAKARDYVRSAERNLLDGICKALSVPRAARRDSLAPVVRAITNEYLQNGTVSKQTIDGLFEQAYAQGVVADEEFFNQYKHIKDHLRSTAVTLAEQDRSDIADYYDFKRQAGGLLKIRNEGGLPVDVAYQELQDMAPELFPDYITHPADQLMRMLQVAQSIEVTYRGLREFYGDDAADQKRDARHEFEEAIDTVLHELRMAKRYVDDKDAEIDKAPTTVEEAEAAWVRLKEVRRNYEKVMAKNLLTEHDQRIVGDLLYGKATLENLDPERDNVKGITAVYEAKQEYARICKLLTDYKRNLKGELRAEADELLETANEWKDKGSGLAYSRETMRRNVLDIVKDPEVADKILRKYFEPVAVAEAAATRFKEKYRNRVGKLGLSRKVRKGDKVSEAHAVQLLGEALDNIALIESSRGRLKHRDGKTLTEWKAVVQELWESSPSLDRAKIEKAVQEFREIYDDLFQQMNRVRVQNGYEPVNYRRGYFPHFQPGNSDGILAHFGRILGISTEVTALPTTINGLTHTFRPGIQWFGNALERTGFATAYDAVEGFDKYIEGVASVIHQTENIQRLRALASQIRYRTSDEGIRKQVDAVMQDERFTEEEKKAQIDSIYEHARFTLSNFVVELDEYTNLLANKKSSLDRDMERFIGRWWYNLLKWAESSVAMNMIAGNLSSALTNVIPLTQAAARMGNINMAVGMWKSVKAIWNDDGMVETSTFLTNRRGSDPLVQTWKDKGANIAGLPMELIDQFVADSIVRGAYYRNIKRGLTEDEAMHQADLFAASVMADRSKGAMPTIFAARNPLTKLFTMFQLEVNNQFSEIFKDIPRELRSRCKWVLAAKLLQYFLGAWLFNELFEEWFGRRPALDPIGIVNESVGDFIGYELPNLLELGAGVITGDMPSFKTKKKNAWDGIKNTAENVLGELPFSAALGFVGIGEDSRIPVESALPDINKLGKAASIDSGWSAKKRLKTAADEISKPITYLALPFGGNQISKIVKGIITAAQGGSYTVDNEGNDILQYPMFVDVWSVLRAAVMGKSTLPEAQDWVDSGFDSFSAKATATYQGILDVGVEDRDAYALVDELRHAKGIKDVISKADVQRNILKKSDVSAEGKVVAYCGLVATDTELEWLNRLLELDPDAQSVFDVAVGLKAADAHKGDAKRTARAEAIADSALTEAQKIVAVESFLGTEWQTEKGNPTPYAKFRDALETGLTVDDYMELYCIDADGVMDKYLKYTDSGLSATEAAESVKAMYDLTPVAGKEDVSNIQKWRAAVDSQSNTEDQLAALSVEMTPTQHQKATVANDYGIAPKAYVSVLEVLPKYNEDGKGDPKQAEVKSAIEAMSGKLSLSTEQKAALWQVVTGAKSAKNNPYSTAIGQQIIDALEKLKQEEDDKSLSFSELVARQIMANM